MCSFLQKKTKKTTSVKHKHVTEETETSLPERSASHENDISSTCDEVVSSEATQLDVSRNELEIQLDKNEDEVQTVTSSDELPPQVETEPLTEVQTKIETPQVITPSAPPAEITYPELPKLVSEPRTETDVTRIEPFTKEQLSALYSNTELEATKEFIHCFVESELRMRGSKRQHPLVVLLTSYAAAREHLRENNRQIDDLQKDIKTLAEGEGAWSVNTVNLSSGAKCRDGVYVTAQHNHLVAQLKSGAIEQLASSQKRLRRLANQQHQQFSYDIVSVKSRIER